MEFFLEKGRTYLMAQKAGNKTASKKVEKVLDKRKTE